MTELFKQYESVRVKRIITDRNLVESNVGERLPQVGDIARTQGKIAEEKALKDPQAMSTRPLPHEPGDRKCLKCNETFRSKSAANRICKKCSQINASLKVSEAQLARERGAKRLNGNLIEEQDTYEMNFS